MTVDLNSVNSRLRRVENNLDELERNLGQLDRGISAVNDNLNVVHHQVVQVANEQQLMRQKLEQLYDQFTAFVAADRQEKQKQYAATRIGLVRQEIEQKFGHYDVVRRTTTGILQATDLQMVRQHTMHTVTEQLMITTPGYWLAPALIALTAWIQDDRPLAERAVAEAIRRDDNKTSLFFALISRRARRNEAVTKWLSRYFQMQDPMNLDREVVVMLDALANGVFGGSALAACSTVIEQWLHELEQQAGFVEDQRKRWTAHLDVMTPKTKETDYPTLQQYSPTAARLMASLAAARRNQVIHGFFTDMFTGELVVPHSMEAAVDSLLDSLVTNYDDEELPLRREERLLELIVDEDGDKTAARKRFDAEAEAHREQTDFAAILTSSAMSPEQVGATRATQRYAVSRSRHWMAAAHADLTGYRAEVTKEDARAEDVRLLLESLSSPQFVLQRPEQRNAVV